MANDRVINLPANQMDPDSSGTGAMLFDMMVKQPQELKKTDAIEGIKNKYKMEAASQANEFDQGMAKLRSQLHMQETEATWQHEQSLRQQEAQGLEQLVGTSETQGIKQPGFGVTNEGQAPEAGFAGTPKSAPINPNALVEARSMFAENIKNAGMIRSEAEKEQLHRTLGLTDSNDAAQAKALADNFEARGDKATADKLRAAYGTPGLADHATWQTVQKDYMSKYELETAKLANKMAIAKEISDRGKSIANIRASVARLASQAKIDDRGFTELNKIHGAIQSDVRSLTGRRNQLLQSQIMETPGTPKYADYDAQIANIDTLLSQYEEQGMTVRQSMQRWQNAANPNQPGPTPAAPTAPAVVPPANPSNPGSWGKAQRIR